MNPSASGWITKLLRDLTKDQKTINVSIDNLYDMLRVSGFIYGNSIDTIIVNAYGLKYSEEEKTKINLLTALIITYYDTIENSSTEDCIEVLLQFYNIIHYLIA